MTANTSISVYFNNFWEGFIERTNPMDCSFFLTLLEKTYDCPVHISTSLDSADVLVESIFGNMSHIFHKKWKSTILFTGEAGYWGLEYVDKYDCVLGFQQTRGKFVMCPLYIIYLVTNPTFLQQINDHDTNTKVTTNTMSSDIDTTNIPPNHASVVVSHIHHGRERLTFLDNLQKQMPVFFGGKYNNNIGYVIQGGYESSELTNFYKKGKFAITMENGDCPYYITEKIINGFRSGVIPVYWGSPRIGEFFNPKRFLQLKSSSQTDMNELITRMVNMTDKEYLDIIHEPIMVRSVDNVCDEIFASVKKILTSSSS